MKHKLNEFEQDPTFVEDFSKGLFVADVCSALREEGISRSELARRLGVERQWVTKILNERDNFTIRTMSRIASALDRRLTLRLIASNEEMVLTTQVSARGVISPVIHPETGLETENAPDTLSFAA